MRLNCEKLIVIVTSYLSFLTVMIIIGMSFRPGLSRVLRGVNKKC